MKKGFHMLVVILTIVGALNWGLIGVGAFAGQNWNVVNLILGSWPMLEWLVYILVGISAIIMIVHHKKDCKTCM
jgi:uncharacterized membrane protein YuzA (DUF378 family)